MNVVVQIFFLIIYLVLAALGLCCCLQAFSSCREWGLPSSGGAWASHRGGFSCGTWALGTQASGVAALGLSSCGTWPELLHSTWNLLRPGIEPVSPALTGRFFSIVPPGKSSSSYFVLILVYHSLWQFLDKRWIEGKSFVTLLLWKCYCSMLTFDWWSDRHKTSQEKLSFRIKKKIVSLSSSFKLEGKSTVSQTLGPQYAW